ncbi:DIMBOA UDP-glucosyltransferase BX9-like [Sorghum bicolor]|uniref:2,4-dihydroxy-7-methoxy-2H-1,4-benzoxazin-3(4H)-one 2-D-glucosyltransferase n=1 Tax=Sorghum bicolor TaxID=4558 RepID=A0A1B6P9Y8_SORBI|nr:DIMBOA UDP-glucosyltransferase BX9-like [Sorghum bicolor]KXG22529.1 hypothetical protein SORBI_3009G230400 [Sorghum bicolor]KXG22530.1 hypothetical protein SORBI_3009G230400 [Sorghum bicolor]OQU78416.1 hypothetical protein SORBI_3009G230400 [Sorghum bicolor]|eukprot:XP_021302775.1 DIMBOA UDP-glucosyltransferase BX9-like [Sorghum bicolor]
MDAMEPSSGADAGRRVVLFPLPYQGHLNPMLRLAAALHRRGLAIIVLHTDLQPLDPANHPTEYRFESLSADVPAELMASKDIARVVMDLNASFAAPFKDRVAALVADKESGGVDCVITDAVWFSAQAAAQELGVPSLGLFTNSAASFRTFMAYPTLIEKGYLPVQESKKDDPVPELPPFRVKDLERIDTSSLYDFASMVGNVVARARQASGLILNSFDAIEANNVNKIREELSIPVFAVGPLNKLSPSVVKTNLMPGGRECLDWLDTQAPGSVLYVSFGSIAAMDAPDFVELAWGLADSKRPFVWAVRPSLVRSRSLESAKLQLPDGLEEEIHGRGKIVYWAPQEEVLSHPAICAFLTHNGWNSTVESISQGVPMLCRPCFGDQFGTARYVCDFWKVGVEIGVVTQLRRGNIRAAIDKLMDDKQAKEYRDRAKDLKEMAEKCATKDGSSHRALVSLVDFIISF